MPIVGPERKYLLPTDNPSGGTAIRPCVVRTLAPNNAGRMIEIGFVRIEDGEYRIGPITNAMVWPGTRVLDYASFAQPDGENLLPHTTVLPAVRLGVLWYVLQLPRFAFTNQDNQYRRTDCLPFGI
jgi:hypothetical protein